MNDADDPYGAIVAADAANQSAAEAQQNSVGQLQPQDIVWPTHNAMLLAGIILTFAVVVLGMASYLIRLGKDTSEILRVFGTIIIVTLTVFLIIVGYSNDQLQGVLGLLGTIAGYLLGRDASANATSRKSAPDPDPAPNPAPQTPPPAPEPPSPNPQPEPEGG